MGIFDIFGKPGEKTEVRVTKSTKKFTVNGVDYERLEDVPAEHRHLPADKNGNGMPDFADNILADKDGNGVPDILGQGSGNVEVTRSVTQKYIVNGKEYSSLDEMPPEVRKIYDSIKLS